MPAIWRPDTLVTEVEFSFISTPSHTLEPRSKASEEAAALPDGKRALTPIIAGTISGACIAIAWFVALVHLLYKRHKRRKRYKQLGADAASIKSRKEQEERRKKQYIVPPDPAVLEGSHYPGERVVLEEQTGWGKGKGKRRQRTRRRASSSGSIGFGSGSGLMNGFGPGSGSGSSTNNGKGKEREVASPPSPRRMHTTPQGHGRRHSFSGSWRSHSYRSGIPKVAEEDEEETLELRPHPFYQLSTIIAASDSHANLPRIQPPLPPPPSPPPKEDMQDVDLVAPVPRRSSITVQDIPVDNDDYVSLVQEYAAPRLHKYPPSRK